MELTCRLPTCRVQVSKLNLMAQMRARALLVVILCSSVRGAVIQKIFGANTSQIGFASSGGGTHVYLTGTDLGSAFAVRHSDSNPRPSPFASIHPAV